eukprot:24619-Prorocentrum_minimum.AAC.1
MRAAGGADVRGYGVDVRGYGVDIRGYTMAAPMLLRPTGGGRRVCNARRDVFVTLRRLYKVGPLRTASGAVLQHPSIQASVAGYPDPGAGEARPLRHLLAGGEGALYFYPRHSKGEWGGYPASVAFGNPRPALLVRPGVPL